MPKSKFLFIKRDLRNASLVRRTNIETRKDWQDYVDDRIYGQTRQEFLEMVSRKKSISGTQISDVNLRKK